MRFFENGPLIPDDLLVARDEGRVVFFCGAGVSRARAGLLDFFGLADEVIRTLGVATDSPARKILTEAREIDRRTGVGGLISADRVFGILEREFLVRDIESAVAKALRQKKVVDLSAHRILLDLATTQEGRVQLVTTNFDRLFDDCDSDLHVWQPPRLPDPSRHNEMDGITYLHGCATKDYSGSAGDGFVLSSSRFGQAYLSDGWATTFFKEIIDRYVVVFVGYSADDPPVHYLLEALNKKEGQLSGVYAFQGGAPGEASERWRHKGVEAIAYADEGSHQVLWESLEAWAERARGPQEWYKSVIDLAQKGPCCLQPHERGQVAHIVSTFEGARLFSEGDDPPPAEWLCVFDPYRRYAKPGNTGGLTSPGPFVDPFELYGLDSDTIPQKIAPDDYHAKREVPKGAWDAFAANRLDRQDLRDDNFSALRGHWSITIPRLAGRLNQIGVWIQKIAYHPATVWWAADQTGLHPNIQGLIKWDLEHSKKDIPPVIHKAWRYLFEAWEVERSEHHGDWYNLKEVIKKCGWDSTIVRKYADIDRPLLKVEQQYWSKPRPPEAKKDLRIEEMFNLDVDYSEPIDDIIIPDEFLAVTVGGLRKNLEHALQLEKELGGYGLINISPIVPDERPDISRDGRTRGLSGAVIRYSALFNRLVTLDSSLAWQELMAWPVDDDTIFSRLKIYASRNTELMSGKICGEIVTGLTKDAFWSSGHQRDLLLLLSERWKEFPKDIQKEIEKRLLEGREKWDGEEDEEYEERKAWESVNRINWLAENNCTFIFDLEVETKRLQVIAPDWQPEYATKAAESHEGRGGFVRTETEHSLLLREPLSSVLSKALELSGRDDDFLVNMDPFGGLSTEHPVRAFSALIHAAKQNEYPEWAWRTFLNDEARKADKPKLSALIAERICQYSDEAITGFLYPISDWLGKISKQLASLFPNTFDKILSKLITVLQIDPPAGSTSIVRGRKDPDWTMEAINAPAGKIAKTLFNDPRKDDLKKGKGFSADWLNHVEGLLSLGGDLRRHALVIFSHNLNWFYWVDPKWTEANLVCVFDSENDDEQNAVWSGFLWGAKVPDPKLYIRIKTNLLTVAKEQQLAHRGYGEVLAGMILSGWGSINKETKERYILNEEMRDVLLHSGDIFRSRILSQIARWSKSKDGGSGEKWSAMVPEFLLDVWPRQRSVKSSTISARLCDLLFSSTELFQKIVEIVLPLLTPIDQGYIGFLQQQKVESIIDLCPQQVLALLHTVLPDTVVTWPYNIEDVFRRISEADNSLNSDERLLELKRKWNSR